MSGAPVFESTRPVGLWPLGSGTRTFPAALSNTASADISCRNARSGPGVGLPWADAGTMLTINTYQPSTTDQAVLPTIALNMTALPLEQAAAQRGVGATHPALSKDRTEREVSRYVVEKMGDLGRDPAPTLDSDWPKALARRG